jgi:hypothetical protein
VFCVRASVRTAHRGHVCTPTGVYKRSGKFKTIILPPQARVQGVTISSFFSYLPQLPSKPLAVRQCQQCIQDIPWRVKKVLIVASHTTSTYTEVYLPKILESHVIGHRRFFGTSDRLHRPLAPPVPGATTKDLRVSRNIPTDTLQIANNWV